MLGGLPACKKTEMQNLALTTSGTLLTLFQPNELTSCRLCTKRMSDASLRYLLITGDGVAIMQYRCQLSLENSDGVAQSGAGACSAPSKSATALFPAVGCLFEGFRVSTVAESECLHVVTRKFFFASFYIF